MDLERKIYTLEVAGKPLKLEISKLAGQTNASVMGTYGETTVLVTVVMSERERDVNYLPLSVDYEEKFYAAGKIIGSRFIRREGRPSEEAILSGRLVDRVIRPLFDHRMRRDIQVVITILSIDEENDPDFISLITASTVLAISDIPWNGPVGGVKIAQIGEKIIVNPSNSFLIENYQEVKFQTFIAGIGEKINMIELGGNEAAEADVVKACAVAQKEVQGLINFQNKVVKELGKPKTAVSVVEAGDEIKKQVKEFVKDKLDGAVSQGKQEGKSKVNELKKDLFHHLNQFSYPQSDLNAADLYFEELIDDLVHEKAITEDKRPDGRKMDEVRNLYVEVGTLPRTHGSAIFTRGQTQALAVVTLGPPGAEQMIETIEFSGTRRFLLHYNFPPYSVGETGVFRGPGRRDIGHGALAEKALRALIPPKENFPYTIRVVSEILSSNGSSSMATVCAASLALMDAGVPIPKPTAGIAMGLMSDRKGNYKILTDIQGPEDHHGDMDLKVAGTTDGINALQMDVKVEGVTLEILEKAFAQAKKARLEILETMKQALDKPRAELSKHAPRVFIIDIDPERVGELIGPGGKVINGIIARTGVTSIDIDDEKGKVFITSTEAEAAGKALAEVEAIFKEYKVGEIVEGEVVKILDFGAIVEFDTGGSGMIHVSELKEGFVKKVEDVVKMGDKVRAVIIKTEPNGKIGLSLKQLKDN